MYSAEDYKRDKILSISGNGAESDMAQLRCTHYEHGRISEAERLLNVSPYKNDKLSGYTAEDYQRDKLLSISGDGAEAGMAQLRCTHYEHGRISEAERLLNKSPYKKTDYSSNQVSNYTDSNYETDKIVAEYGSGTEKAFAALRCFHYEQGRTQIAASLIGNDINRDSFIKDSNIGRRIDKEHSIKNQEKRFIDIYQFLKEEELYTLLAEIKDEINKCCNEATASLDTESDKTDDSNEYDKFKDIFKDNDLLETISVTLFVAIIIVILLIILF